MNAGAWILMLVSLAFVWTLAIWCYVRVLRAPRESLPDSSHDDGPDE